mmetsp:Transcript_2255/g.7595  ORF Transcript_2255/g.7595 Transcript_2255/m.7595 type:complete len:232 (-) Transcript_2255:155-850(-)
MQAVPVLQAILDEALSALQHSALPAEAEGHGVLEAAGEEREVLAARHELLERPLVRRVDGEALVPHGVALPTEAGVLVPQVVVAEPVHLPGHAAKLGVVAAVDGEARGEAPMWVESETAFLLADVVKPAAQLRLGIVVLGVAREERPEGGPGGEVGLAAFAEPSHQSHHGCSDRGNGLVARRRGRAHAEDGHAHGQPLLHVAAHQEARAKAEGDREARHSVGRTGRDETSE